MKRFTRFAITIFSLAAATSLQAYTLEGEVTCLDDGSPLAGLEVSATQGADVRTDTTAADGSYTINHNAGVWEMAVDTSYPVTGPATVEGSFLSGVDFQVDDPACRGPICGDGILDPGEACDDGNNIDGDGCSAVCTIESFCGDGILDPGEQCDDGNSINGDGCSAICTIEGGGEGCTPGYWRQAQHFDSYPAAYPPEALFNVVFGVEAFDADLTLSQATRLKGGGLNALGRHAVAALLNAASGDVSYDRSAQEVIDNFVAAYNGDADVEYVKNLFAGFNEQSCPLN